MTKKLHWAKWVCDCGHKYLSHYKEEQFTSCFYETHWRTENGYYIDKCGCFEFKLNNMAYIKSLTEQQKPVKLTWATKEATK